MRWDEVTGSTNTTASELARAGSPEWTLVATGHQTAGRGRLGRRWEDRPGGALIFSFVLRPGLAPEDTGLLSLLAGAAMAEAVRDEVGVQVRCKWPNDLMDGERKVGGILAESEVEGASLRHVVIGIGVNLEAPGSVSGATGLGMDVDRVQLLTGFLRTFRAGYRPGEPDFAASVVDRWSASSATLGRRVEATRSGGVRVRGAAVGLDERGGLVIDTGAGLETVAFGDVLHVG